MSHGSCNYGCTDFRPHSKGWVVCNKCGEVYQENDVNNKIDLTINEEYEYEKPGGFDHMST